MLGVKHKQCWCNKPKKGKVALQSLNLWGKLVFSLQMKSFWTCSLHLIIFLEVRSAVEPSKNIIDMRMLWDMNSACKLVGYYRVAAYGLRYDTTSPVTINFWLKYAQIDLVRKMIKLKGLFCGTNMVLQKKKKLLVVQRSCSQPSTNAPPLKWILLLWGAPLMQPGGEQTFRVCFFFLMGISYSNQPYWGYHGYSVLGNITVKKL